MHSLPMASRNLNLQSLYLKPETAELLDALSAETRIPKQTLLRDAVDDLLTKHGKTNNAWYADIVGALRLASAIANHYRSGTAEVNWQAKCQELRKRADDILAALGKK